MMADHELKIWPEFFEMSLDLKKPFELRKDDRGFAVGDFLRLREWDPQTQEYSGREIHRRVTSLLRHRPDASCAATFGLQPGYVILGVAWARSISSGDRGGK
jgi:hypothetical protein